MNQVLADLRQFTSTNLQVRCNEFGSPFGAFDASANVITPRAQQEAPLSKVTFTVPSVSAVSPTTRECDVVVPEPSLPSKHYRAKNAFEGSSSSDQQSTSNSEKRSEQSLPPVKQRSMKRRQSKAPANEKHKEQNTATDGIVREVVRVELQESFEQTCSTYHDNELLAAQRKESDEISDEARLRERQHRESTFGAIPRPSARWHSIRQKAWSERSPGDVKLIREEIFSHEHPFFEKFSLDALLMLAQDVEFQSFEADETIFTEGETGAEFYLILSGSVSVWKNEQTIHESHQTHSELQQKLRRGRAKSYYEKLTRVNDLYKGDGFGELALYAPKAASFLRTATVCTTSETECLIVRRVLFNRVKRAQKETELSQIVAFCRQLPHIAKLSREASVDLASVMKIRKFGRKSTIIRQDSTPACIYLLSSGEVSMIWSQKGAPAKGRRACPPVEVSSLVPRCLFGEFGAFGGKTSPVSFVAHSDVTVFIAKNNDFDRLVTQTVRAGLVQSLEQRHLALRTKIDQVLEIRNAPLKNVRRMLKVNARKHALTNSISQNRSWPDSIGDQTTGKCPSPRTSAFAVPSGFMSRADSNDLPRPHRQHYRVTERPWKVVDFQKTDAIALLKGEHLSSQLHRRRLGIPPPIGFAIKIHELRRNWSEIGRHADETTVRENPQVSFKRDS